MSYWLQIVHTSLKYHHGWKGVVFDAHLLKTVAYRMAQKHLSKIGF